MTQIEFLYDFASPNCYVAYHKLRELRAKRGLDVCLTPLFLEFIERDETKLRLRKDTERAYERGVFGAPTYFIDGNMYWGTPELLWFLEKELS